MLYSDIIIFIMEIIGTIAFAISGAIIGVQKKMDLFGINVLGITTAVGGGMVRDLILGVNPPATFRNATYTLTAIASSTIVFCVGYFNKKTSPGKYARLYDLILLIGDTIGLGIFSVMGSYAAIKAGYTDNCFLTIFVGVMTGVGGGMIRDIMAGNTPYILVKHIYAVASLAGAAVFTLLLPYFSYLQCMVAGASIVMLIRFLAAHYRWNLPRIH